MRKLESINEVEEKKVDTSTVRLRPKKIENQATVRESLLKRFTRFITIKRHSDQNEENENCEMKTIKGLWNEGVEEMKPLVNRIKDDLYYRVEKVGEISELIKNDNRDIQCCLIVEKKLFIGFKNNPEIHIFSFNDVKKAMILENVWQTILQDFPIYPLQMKTDKKGNLYLSGYYCPGHDKDEKVYLLIKYDSDRNVLIKTKKYNFSRFSDFDIDVDGNLVIISATKIDNTIFHVCKMSSDFKTIFYKFNFSSASSKYFPERIACLGIKGKTWLAAYKEFSDVKEPRLISFNSCAEKENNEAMPMFMEKVCIAAWCSGTFLPAQMTKFTDDCILAIDNKTRSLFGLSWDSVNQSPDVLPISCQTQPLLTNICSDGNGKAYLFTNNIIYRFDKVVRK